MYSENKKLSKEELFEVFRHGFWIKLIALFKKHGIYEDDMTIEEAMEKQVNGVPFKKIVGDAIYEYCCEFIEVTDLESGHITELLQNLDLGIVNEKLHDRNK